ncbi:MAG: hypothetical protein DMF17_07365 [Verrucomicrobia bacterium]|nr:MAG: hypothetical protein DMF17_07365 [Verrucomicrobiota bacterium]
MAWVYILRGASGRYYFGSTDDLERRITEHQRGDNHTTRHSAEQSSRWPAENCHQLLERGNLRSP